MSERGAPTGEISTAEAFHVLADDDLNHVVIEELWGERSADWLITQRALDETPTDVIEHRRQLAENELAPVIPFARPQNPQRSAA